MKIVILNLIRSELRVLYLRFRGQRYRRCGQFRRHASRPQPQPNLGHSRKTGRHQEEEWVRFFRKWLLQIVVFLDEKKLKVDEFLPIFSQVKKDKEQGTFEDFLECLKLYDKEENGKMMAAELSHTLLSLGEYYK